MPKGSSSIAIALVAVLMVVLSFLMLSGSAQAQPTLEFSNTPPLKLRLADKQDADTACNPETGKQTKAKLDDSAPELRTTNATVWVRYSDSTDSLKRVRFSAQAKANSSGGSSSSGSIVLAAAAGELATVCLLLYEISFIGILLSAAVPIIQVVLVLTGVAVTVVAYIKAFEVIKKGKFLPEDKALVQRFYRAWEEKTRRSVT